MVVRALDKHGQPLKDVAIVVGIWEIEQTGKYPKNYVTDELGIAEIKIPQRLRILRLSPSKPGFVPLFLNFDEGTHEEGRLIPDTFEFRLEDGHQLSGRITDKSGSPIVNARVQVRAQRVDAKFDITGVPIVNSELATGKSAAVTDENGHWQITNAPAPRAEGGHRFLLYITHPDFAGDTRWGELQQQQSITTPYLRDGTATITLAPGIAIQGLVTGPNGEPVTKGLVVWTDRPYGAIGDFEVPIDSSGHYRTSRLKPGTYPLTVLAPGFAPQRQMVTVNQDLGAVNRQLQPGNPIRIEIVDPAGNPIPRASVRIANWRRTEAIYNDKRSHLPDSGIPNRANEDGIFEWTWAPDDGVQYQVGAEGFESRGVTLVAQPEPHRIQLPHPVIIRGTVVDASTGSPLDRFRVIPVKEFSPDFYSTDFQGRSILEGREGKFELRIESHGQMGNRYRVRVEADGYRTALGRRTLAVGEPPLQEDFRMKPSPASVGEVLDHRGIPTQDFTVAIASPTAAPGFSLDRVDTDSGKAFRVQGSHQFEIAATFEPQLIRVFNDSGFAQVLQHPDESIGTLRLQPWAVLSGRLMQGSVSIPGEWVYFRPVGVPDLKEARFRDSFQAKTDSNGYFQFDHLPPMSGVLGASLGPWRESPLDSNESVPIHLSPGDRREILLGGQGVTVTGRIIATERDNDSFSKKWSLNYLVSRDRGEHDPARELKWSFTPDGPVQTSWLRRPDFSAWMATRLHYFVKLGDDGKLRIHGVRPGEYDLVIQLYEEPAGCLVEAVGQKIVSVAITADQIAAGEVNLGDVEVPCRIGPRPGADMRAYQFTDSSGQVCTINEMTGKFVLFQVWASWCGPCLDSMPSIKAAVDRNAKNPLVVVGLNIDEDIEAARTKVEQGNLNWAQNYLGAESVLMRQLAISSVPAYYLIGPDGKLIEASSEWKSIDETLRNRLE